MIYKEENLDLFSVCESHKLIHCISADLNDITVSFDKKFNAKKKLSDLIPWGSNVRYWDADKRHHGYCIRIDNIIYLVIKRNDYDNPTLETVKRALEDFRDTYYYPGLKIAMSKTGYGLDKLQWQDVSALIKEVFANTDIEILVCYL